MASPHLTAPAASESDRAAGVLVGQACGDALGVPYEFAALPVGEPEMVGGGLGPYAPGVWSDDTQMAICIARVATTGADPTADDALDAVAGAFLDWHGGGATDIGLQTSRVLTRARGLPGRPGARLAQAAREDLAAHPGSAGNGALMRTAVVGLTRLDDRLATAAAASAIARLTHPAADAVDACVLWSEAVRRAVVEGDPVLADGIDLLPAVSRDRWLARVRDAGQQWPIVFSPNGWTVTALQAAWAAVSGASRGDLEPGDRVRRALVTAVRAGDDTDTVAAIAGGLAGAAWGQRAVPEDWRQVVHGWPGLRADDLGTLAVDTARRGRT